MIARRGASWTIVVISTCVLLAGLSSAVSARLRKPRRWSTVTPRVPYHAGPVIVKVIHKDSDDEFTRVASIKCQQNACEHARENLDVSKARYGRDNLLPDERYVVYPKRYERFVSRKNTGHANRHRRYAIASPIASRSDASDRAGSIGRDDNASETRNENKSKLKKVTLRKAQKHVRIKDSPRSPGETSRTRRNLADYQPRRNTSDYHAQRRAVMERYYARQREINARYANRTNNIPARSSYNDVFRDRPVQSNATLFRLGHEYPNRNSTASDSVTFRFSSVTIDPIYSNELERNGTPSELSAGRQNVVSATDLRFDYGLSRARNSSNVERSALDYHATTTACPLSGVFAPKTRSKQAKDCDDTQRGDIDVGRASTVGSTDSDETGTEHRIWGECKGKVVYQHNLLLGLKGPSNLDTLFEVIIQGPVCITCVEVLRYNKTRAIVTLDSGGHGYEYVKLKLKGYENEGFSYIIKVWAVRKIDADCDDM